MNLKITSPGGTIFDGKINQLTIPTESGEITILPDHQPLTTIVKSWVASFVTQDPVWDDYIVVDNKAQISLGKWLLMVDGETIVITTSAATTSPEESSEVLEKMKEQMTKDLEKIKDDGNAEELEKALENMAKVEADLKLVKLKYS